VDDRRPRFHGVPGIQDGRELLILDLDELQGLLGDLGGLRGHEGHAVPHEAHLGIQREGVQRPGDGVRLPGRRIDHPRQILIREHGNHPRERAGFADIDAFDPGVRDRAFEHFGVKHAAQLEVIGESRLALDQPQGVHLLLRLAHHPGLRDRLGEHDGRQDDRPGPEAGPALRRRWGDLLRGERFGEGDRPFRGDDHPLRLFFDRGNRLPAHAGGGPQHRLHRLQVAGAPAEDAAEGLPDLRLGGVGVAVQEGFGGQHEGGGAEAALDGAGLHEGLLDRMQTLCPSPAQLRRPSHSLHGEDGAAVDLRRQGDAGEDRGSIEEDGAHPTGAVVAPMLDAVISGAPEHVQQPRGWGDGEGPPLPVDGDGDLHWALLASGGDLKTLLYPRSRRAGAGQLLAVALHAKNRKPLHEAGPAAQPVSIPTTRRNTSSRERDWGIRASRSRP